MTPAHLPTVTVVLAVAGVTLLAALGVVDGEHAVAVYTGSLGYAFGKVSPQPKPTTREGR